MDEELQLKLKEGVELFNAHRFYECHDVLEDLWFGVRDNSRNFYQGLIHFAVAFHHILERQNPTGASSQLQKGIKKLIEYKPEYNGIELEKLLVSAGTCLDEINKYSKTDVIDFDADIIPKIELKL